MSLLLLIVLILVIVFLLFGGLDRITASPQVKNILVVICVVVGILLILDLVGHPVWNYRIRD